MYENGIDGFSTVEPPYLYIIHVSQDDHPSFVSRTEPYSPNGISPTPTPTSSPENSTPSALFDDPQALSSPPPSPPSAYTTHQHSDTPSPYPAYPL